MHSIKKYRLQSKTLIYGLDKIFDEVNSLNVNKIITQEVDLNSIWWEVSKIIDISNNGLRKITKELNELSEEEYEDWGYKIQDEADELNNTIDWKGMSIQSLLDGLGRLSDMAEEENLFKYFNK